MRMVQGLQFPWFMGRLLVISFLLAFLSACGKPPGFKASEFTYTRVIAEPQVVAKAKSNPKPGSILRSSNKIQFEPLDSNAHWDPKNVHIKAKVKVGERSYGEVEFEGSMKDSKILLTPVDANLKDQLKAQMYCTSEDDSCTESFIDVFFREDEVIYHDQIIAKPKVKESPAPSTQPAPTPKPDKNKQPSQNSEEEDEEETEIIRDGIYGEDVEISGYVGTSDDEIRKIFNLEETGKKTENEVKEDKKETPVPAPTPAPAPASAPNPTPTPKRPEPVKNSDSKDKKETSPSTESKPPVKNEVDEDAFEKFRARNQVYGTPSNGRLNKGTNFLDISRIPGMHFFITNPNGRYKDYFGSFDLAILLKKLGQGLQSLMPGRKLAVTSITTWGGGKQEAHDGHQNGTDIDIRYLTNNENLPSKVVSKGRVNSSFLVSNQWKLLKMAFDTKMVEVIYVGPAIKKAMCEEARRVHDLKPDDSESEAAEALKRIQTWPGHNDHFHVRIRCSSDHPNCIPVKMKPKNVGC